jgi:hypothetical protein
MKTSLAILVAMAFTTSATAQVGSKTDCPEDEAVRLHPSVRTAVAREKLGVEAFTGGQYGPDRMLITVLAPLSLFECSDASSDPGPTTRHLVAWKQTGHDWREVARNSEVLYSTDSFGEYSISMEFISNGFRLLQSTSAPRYERSDVLTFHYDSILPGLRVTQWATREFRNDNGIGPRGDAENWKILNERTEKDPRVSPFDGYRGEVDFANGKGWIEFSAWAELPKLRRFDPPSKPISLSNTRWPFPEE